MSSKKLIRLSKIDCVINNLLKEKQKYLLTAIGYVDLYEATIRRLEYGDTIVLEQYVKTKDKTLDDFIISKTFLKSTEPKNWKFKIIK